MLKSLLLEHFVLNTRSDIDECSYENGGCEQTCINTLGSYSCGCKSGFEAGRNMNTCTGSQEHCRPLTLAVKNNFQLYSSKLFLTFFASVLCEKKTLSRKCRYFGHSDIRLIKFGCFYFQKFIGLLFAGRNHHYIA